jgi:Uma2 family endonuclease
VPLELLLPDTVPREIRVQTGRVLDDAEFFKYCQQNSDWRIERAPDGEIVIMPPAGLEASGRNVEITTQVAIWAKRDGSGKVFDSSFGFKLRSGAIRSPDTTWILKNRLKHLRLDQEGFPLITPDFVIELRSRTDRLAALQRKMVEYREDGVRLGWLIDPFQRRVWVYRGRRKVEKVDNATRISADPELPVFSLDLREVWTLDQ